MDGQFIIIDSSWYEHPKEVHTTISCGGVVCHCSEGVVFVALSREKGTNQYVLPKGRMEAGECFEDTARREIREEVGVADLHLLQPLGVCQRLSYEKQVWKEIHLFLFVTRHLALYPTDPKHAGQAAWFPLDHLPPLIWPEQSNILRHHRKRIIKSVKSWFRGQ